MREINFETAPAKGQHTPGPWTHKGTHVYAQRNPGGYRFDIAECFRDIGAQHADANARLIAAAPAPAEALRECCQAIAAAQANMTPDEIDEHWQDQNLRDAAIKARAALALLEGGES